MSDPTAGVIVDPNNPESIPRAPAPPSAGLSPVNWDALENDEGMQDVAQRTSQLAARIGGGMPKETPAQAAKAKNAKEATSYADLCGLAQQRYEPEGYTWKIRVERTAPSAGAVKGIIGTYEAMTDEEFEQTFGGQKYRCVLLLEEETPTGQPVLRATTHIAEFSIPGPPKTKVQQVEIVGGGAAAPGFPSASGPPPGWGPPGGYVAQPQASQVDVIEAKAAVDLQNMLMKHALSGGGSNALERTLETQSTFASTTIQGLQEQVVSLNNALSSMRQAHAAELETERTRYRDLDNSIAGKVAAARDEGERVARAQLQGEITSANTRLDLERRASTDAIERERRFSTETVERERDACTRRIGEVERARLQEVEMLKNDHERAINREKEDKAREVAAVTNNFKLQLDMIDRQTLRDAKQSGDLQQILLESKNTLITQLTAEKGALTTEVAGLRAQVFVPFSEKLKEISTTAQSLGFKPPGDDDDDDDDEPETPAVPAKSAFEQVLAALPQVAPMLPGIMGQLGQFAGIVPPPQQAQAPQPPQVRQLPPPQPYVPPPQAAPVVGGPAPVQASPIISEPKRHRPPPSPMPAPEPVGPTPIVAPTGFVTRGPQPEQPGQIEELLGTLSAQAKGAITGGMAPGDASTLLRNAAGARAAAYHGWIDAENALLLLERSDLNFWTDLTNREWFDAFWSGLGEAPALSLSGSLDIESKRRSGTRQALRPVDRSAPPDPRCGALLFPEEPPERENGHGKVERAGRDPQAGGGYPRLVGGAD